MSKLVKWLELVKGVVLAFKNILDQFILRSDVGYLFNSDVVYHDLSKFC
jgi:hypothetical protein